MLQQRKPVSGKAETTTHVAWTDPESGAEYLVPVEPVYVVATTRKGA